MARILVTNDDGVHAPGIEVLACALADQGHDVLVVAPRSERSGSGAAIGHLAHGAEITVESYALPGYPDVLAFGVDGPPALCPLLGFYEVFGPKPDYVLSGINPGANTGRGLLHSGTVGAVLTAAELGISGAAISMHYPLAAARPTHWSTAAEVALATVEWLAELPRKTALNVNVPDVPMAEVLGVRWGRISAFGPFTTRVVGTVPGVLNVVMTEREEAIKPDTDTALVHAGYVVATALVSPRATEALDVEAALGARLSLEHGRPVDRA